MAAVLGGNCTGKQLSWGADVPGGSCPWQQFLWLAVVLGGSCPGGSQELSQSGRNGVNFPSPNFESCTKHFWNNQAFDA